VLGRAFSSPPHATFQRLPLSTQDYPNRKEQFLNIFSPVLIAAALGASMVAGCASPPMSMSKSGGDMAAMCDMHKKMMGSMSPQDQKAMMDEHMKDMSPEMRTKHMEQMSHCK
jgi:outer membrane murein-binding lipoprotein Lpp